jgi:hypothetical protein
MGQEGAAQVDGMPLRFCVLSSLFFHFDGTVLVACLLLPLLHLHSPV